MGTAIADGNWINMLIFVLCCIIPFGVVYYVLSSTFIKIATSNKGHKKIKYKEKSMKVKGTKTALINKEISHFTQSPMYMFNAGIGLVFMPVSYTHLVKLVMGCKNERISCDNRYYYTWLFYF